MQDKDTIPRERQVLTQSHTPGSVAELREISSMFQQSGLFPDIKTVAQAFVKVQAGKEMGLGPYYSMQKIYIVQGKTLLAAEAMGALIKKSGRYDYRVTEYTDLKVTLQFTDNSKDVFLSAFTMEDARKAGLVKPGSGWEKYPRAMLMSKALSQGARIVCPEVISGAYTPEDFGMSVNPETEQLEGQENAIPKQVKVEVVTPENVDFKTGEIKETPQTGKTFEQTLEETPATEAPDPVTPPAAPPSAMPKTYKTDPATIKNPGDLYLACGSDFALKTRKAVWDELNVKSQEEMVKKFPVLGDAYKTIASVRQ